MNDSQRIVVGFARNHRVGIRELVLIVLALLAYFGIRNLTVGSAAIAYANADRVIRFERALHLSWESRLQVPVVDHPALLTLVNWVYIWGHWPVIITVALVLFRYRRERYHLLRNAMFASAAIGFLFFALIPLAPPRLAMPGVMDTVTLHSHAYRALQPPGLTNQFAAFPSLHFGWNLLAGIAVWGATGNIAVRALSVVGPAAMAVAVVLTANHYVVDVIGGLLVVLIGLGVHQVLHRSRAHSDGDAGADQPPRRERLVSASPSPGARLRAPSRPTFGSGQTTSGRRGSPTGPETASAGPVTSPSVKTKARSRSA